MERKDEHKNGSEAIGKNTHRRTEGKKTTIGKPLKNSNRKKDWKIVDGF
jgi:hypothetical protein